MNGTSKISDIDHVYMSEIKHESYVRVLTDDFSIVDAVLEMKQGVDTDE